MSVIIDCAQLSHRYGSHSVLNNINFSIESGAPVALVGPNGAGKTTLLGLLAGFTRIQSGQVRLFNSKPNNSNLIGKIGTLAQDARLDPLFKIAEQLQHYSRLQWQSARTAKQEVERVLDQVNLPHVAKLKPAELSHGMTKRVMIAQALLGNPELILLDEPTAGLDPENSQIIRQLILDHSHAATFIISSHNLEELERLCQTVMHLNDGQLLVDSLNNESAENNYLTLQLQTKVAENFSQTLKTIDGVISIVPGQQNSFVICYDVKKNPTMDQQILKCLHENHWAYWQLIRGKTLADRLFSKTV